MLEVIIPLSATGLICAAAGPAASTWYLSPSGSDSMGVGSREKPWRTIRFATGEVPDDGSTIILLDGLYQGAESISRQFTKPCLVRAENPCRARLRSPADGNRALTCYDAANVTFQGLEIFGSGSTKGEYLIHISTPKTHHLLFDGCIIHDGYNNDLIQNNLYWNAGQAIPHQAGDLLVPDQDPARCIADPRLPKFDPAVTLPRFDPVKGEFPSGERTIRKEFERLVARYAALGEGSPAMHKADPGNMPEDDTLGHPRGARPDIGCFEHGR
jgi:hypothetical protein